MKKILLSLAAVAALGAAPALAADLKVKAPVKAVEAPSPWDWAFGGALMSDYNFRGISQSNKGPSVTAYSETRYNVNADWQLYAGAQYWAVTLPTNPTCECDLYGGIRPTLGPLALDFGFIYYWYPRERGHASVVAGVPAPGYAEPAYANGNMTYNDTDYWEVYGKGTWEVVKDKFWLGFNEYYSPNWLHTGAYGNFASGTAKVGLPSFNAPIFGDVGWYVSGQVGYYWFGTTGVDPFVFTAPTKLPNYLYWDAGIAFTWKVATLDLRAVGTNLSKVNCNILTGDPGASGVPLGSNWCSTTFIATLKFDLTLANLK
jgi:hypothetical protein